MLPIFLEMGGFYAIKEDAQVVSFTWDDPHTMRVETEPRIVNMVHFRASNDFPDLIKLKPEKGPGAKTCSSCGGTGKFKASLPAYENIVCQCGGLGWLP